MQEIKVTLFVTFCIFT